ncbi:hypothetical protein [Caldicellulosiruptor naganoensis]|nr:hypothetical protein [Caldicellulosiruptor naganoensis]
MFEKEPIYIEEVFDYVTTARGSLYSIFGKIRDILKFTGTTLLSSCMF